MASGFVLGGGFDGFLGGLADQVVEGGDVAAGALVKVAGEFQQGARLVVVQAQVLVEALDDAAPVLGLSNERCNQGG
ncbi:hypothetical protein [Streptomyces albogriseolus]|uniref:hypothetical protein n=1 Tax=Streptomyces albogriseolus TaxID=1887 RepID=UPI0037031571